MPAWKRWGHHSSRAILANISASKIAVKWCEEIKNPDLTVESDLSGSLSSNAMMMSSFMSTMNNNNNNFTNDHNLQWQLWDSFRTGAMWAQAHQQHYASSQQLPIPIMMGSPSKNCKSIPTSSIDWSEASLIYNLPTVSFESPMSSTTSGTEEYDLYR